MSVAHASASASVHATSIRGLRGSSGGFQCTFRCSSSRVFTARVKSARALASRDSLPSGKSIVLTGGSRGLGFCLAREFALRGDHILTCARDPLRLQRAIQAIKNDVPDANIQGVVADVSTSEGIQALEDAARSQFQHVDIVVANAGAASQERKPLRDLEIDDILNTVNANVAGGFLVARMALRLFADAPRADERVYHYFSFGFSDAGAMLSQSAITHKVTKLMLPILDELLRKELRKESPEVERSVGLHQVSPGLLLTDLLLADTGAGVKSLVFNAIAEEPRDVASKLADRLREETTANARIEMLPLPNAAMRMLTTVPRVLMSDESAMRFFTRDGMRVPRDGAVFKDNGVEELFPGM